MERYMSNPMNPSMEFSEKFERMYPDAYTRVYPHVQYLVGSFGDESLTGVTTEDVDRITQEAIRRSNIAADPPAGHTMHTVGDMTRALVIRDFHDRFRRRRAFPFFSPFFFFPFDGVDGFDRDRFRDFDRDREHDRDFGRHDRY